MLIRGLWVQVLIEGGGTDAKRRTSAVASNRQAGGYALELALGCACFLQLTNMLPSSRLSFQCHQFRRSSLHVRLFFRSYHRLLHSRKISTLPQRRTEPFAIGTELRGHSGRTYKVQEVLAERRQPLFCVYRARYLLLEHSHVVLDMTLTAAKCRGREFRD
jgi:hypothetical protein